MARVKRKPDLINGIGINPFTEGLEIPVTKKIQEVKNKFGELDEKEYELEATKYTKIFEVRGSKAHVMDLPIRCKELYLWLIHSIQGGQDIIWIDKQEYMRSNGIKSINTFKEAIKGLYDNLYIYPHASLRDTYWINPHFFFKGSRILKYPDKVRVVKEQKVK